MSNYPGPGDILDSRVAALLSRLLISSEPHLTVVKTFHLLVASHIGYELDDRATTACQPNQVHSASRLSIRSAYPSSDFF